MTTKRKRRAALRCLDCGRAMRTRLVRHQYTECGLPDVVLDGVRVSECPNCGKRAVSIPGLEALHRAIARSLAEKRAGLTPPEVRFLRKWLGFSGVDFAEIVGKTPESVSRWESPTTPMAMDPAVERLLRLMVLTREPVTAYPLERLGEFAAERPASSAVHMKHHASRWTHDAAE
ncbi:MAG: hypothetical protein HY908_19185 [Myxococcales bacterium]|nr:hypothetical protein [Myxococcales bacterium]